MGGKGNSNESTARIRVLKYIDYKDDRKPIQIDTFPWCGVEFGKRSLDDIKDSRNRGDVFKLLRNGRVDTENPDELRGVLPQPQLPLPRQQQGHLPAAGGCG